MAMTWAAPILCPLLLFRVGAAAAAAAASTDSVDVKQSAQPAVAATTQGLGLANATANDTFVPDIRPATQVKGLANTMGMVDLAAKRTLRGAPSTQGLGLVNATANDTVEPSMPSVMQAQALRPADSAAKQTLPFEPFVPSVAGLGLVNRTARQDSTAKQAFEPFEPFEPFVPSVAGLGPVNGTARLDSTAKQTFEPFEPFVPSAVPATQGLGLVNLTFEPLVNMTAQGLELAQGNRHCTDADAWRMHRLGGGSGPGTFPKITSECMRRASMFQLQFNSKVMKTCMMDRAKITGRCAKCFIAAGQYARSHCGLLCSTWCSEACLKCKKKGFREARKCTGVSFPHPKPC